MSVITWKRTKWKKAAEHLRKQQKDLSKAARDHETASKIISIVHGFMTERGLHISFAKTRINTIYEGFDFLSRHYVKKHGVVCTSPTTAAVEKIKAELHDYILNFNKSQRELIMGLNITAIHHSL